jgi:anti-sigma factor RsiW
MKAPGPDDVPIEWLAAYADGELAAEQRDQVEQWLRDNPDAREMLDAQEAFGPNNVDYWNTVSPPTPSARHWNEVAEGIHGAAPAARATRWYGVLGTLGLVATAATILFALPGQPGPCLNHPVDPPCIQPDSPSDDEPFQMASESDVRIISLPEAAAGLLLVGQHPLLDSTLQLASAGEIEFFGVGSDLAGNFPAIPDPLAPDAPMIWAPREP